MRSWKIIWKIDASASWAIILDDDFYNHEFICTRSTSSSNSFRISILSHIASKIYMIMKKLFEMFAEKLSKENMNIIQKKSTFSRFFEFRRTRINSLESVNQSDLKSSNTIILHRFHSAVYSKLTHDHKFSTTFVLSILSLKSMRQFNIVSFTSTFTFKSTSTTIKSSQHSIFKQKTFVTCSFTSSSTSSRSLILSHVASKIYMIINNLFVKFIEKKNNSEKNEALYINECVFRCMIKFKSLIILNLLINQILHRSNRSNRSNQSNSILSSIVLIRHLEFVFQSIKMQKFRILRSK